MLRFICGRKTPDKIYLRENPCNQVGTEDPMSAQVLVGFEPESTETKGD